MRVVLSARGSRGDVHPILAVAAGLRARGHHVRLCVPETFLHRARALDPEAIAYPEDSRDVMAAFDHGWQAARVALAWFQRELRVQTDRLVPLARRADALVSTANEVAAPTAAEAGRVPFARLVYAPVLPGPQPPPLVPWAGLPRLANALLWEGIDRVLDLAARGALNAVRAALGLPPVPRVGPHLAAAGETLLAVSPSLAPPAAAWRYPYRYTGYPFTPELDAPLPHALRRFLESHPAPLYLGFGSVRVRRRRALLEAALEATRRLGRPLLLGRGWTDLTREMGTPLRHDVYVLDEAPHGSLFARCRAVVHHGGSGTLHTAARAGLPQLALPQIADQYYWAHRLHALRLGPAPLRPQAWTRTALVDAIAALVEKPEFAERARDLSQEVRRQDGVAAACAAIERLAA